MDETSSSLLYSRHPEVLAAPLGPDETALLGAARENYYGLNGPGTRIWELLEAPRTFDEICTILMDEFDVDVQECRRDTREHLVELVANSLVTETKIAQGP